MTARNGTAPSGEAAPRALGAAPRAAPGDGEEKAAALDVGSRKSATPRRVLCLRLPYLATDRIRNDRSERARQGTFSRAALASDAKAELSNRGKRCAAKCEEALPARGVRSHAPLVLTGRVGSTVMVQFACPRAAALGLCAGMTLAQARAIAPEIEALDYDEHRDRALLLELADWAVRFSPVVEPLFPDTLLIDITGCRKLFRNTPAVNRSDFGFWILDFGLPETADGLPIDAIIGKQAVDGLCERGLHACAAVADTVGAAYALASACQSDLFVKLYMPTQSRGHGTPHVPTIRNPKSKIHNLVVVPEGCASAYLAPLPPAALRIDPLVVEQLDMLGVRTIGDLLMLPRATLPSRFGPELVLRIEQALGEVFEPITPYLAQPPPAARFVFDGPVKQLAAIQRVAGELLDDVLGQVAQRDHAVRRLDCVLYAERRSPTVVSVRLARASRSAKHVGELLRQQLSGAHWGRAVGAERKSEISDLRFEISKDDSHGFEPEFEALPGISGLMLVAAETSRWRGAAGELFESTEPGDAEELGELLDRLANRLGREAVARAELVDDWQPEMAVRWRDAAISNSKSKISNLKLEIPRPTQLFDPPLPIRVMALVPDGPPTWFALGGREYVVVSAWGSERIETGWWRGPDVRRDYFRLLTESGEQFWVYHDAVQRRWLLHGVFA